MAFMWFIAFLVLLFIEIVTINLVSIWFAMGALASMVAAIFTDSIVIQLLVFIAVSVLVLLITKPIVKKFKRFEITPTNSDRVIGKIGEVTRKIENNKYGEVKIYGTTWTASSKQEIDAGTNVKVLAIEGVKLIVEKEEV